MQRLPQQTTDVRVMMTNATMTQKVPYWFWAASAFGLAWNVFGLFQFAGSLTHTEASLIESGLNPQQAAVMTGYPFWMTIVFAVGVVGGAIGCILLLLRNSLAVEVFMASLVGYVLLYTGDIVHGVFAAMGAPQVVVLTIVVAIAVALLWLSLQARKRFLLI